MHGQLRAYVARPMGAAIRGSPNRTVSVGPGSVVGASQAEVSISSSIANPADLFRLHFRS